MCFTSNRFQFRNWSILLLWLRLSLIHIAACAQLHLCVLWFKYLLTQSIKRANALKTTTYSFATMRIKLSLFENSYYKTTGNIKNTWRAWMFKAVAKFRTVMSNHYGSSANKRSNHYRGSANKQCLSTAYYFFVSKSDWVTGCGYSYYLLLFDCIYCILNNV